MGCAIGLDGAVDWHCVHHDDCAVFLAMFVVFRWASIRKSLKMSVLEEQDGVIMGMS